MGQAPCDHDAALSMGVDVALGTHTVTVFADGPQLFVRDPNGHWLELDFTPPNREVYPPR